MNTRSNLPCLVIDDDIITVTPNREHEFTAPTADVARGYGVTPETLRSHKLSHADELIEGKHFSSVENINAGNLQRVTTLWTKRGIVRLGFFIRSERAKRFRDLAEDLVLRAAEAPPRPVFDPVTDLEAKIAAFFPRNKREIAAYEGLIALHRRLRGGPASLDDPDARDMARLLLAIAERGALEHPLTFLEILRIAKRLGLFKGKIKGEASTCAAVGSVLSRHAGETFILDASCPLMLSIFGKNRQRRYYVERADQLARQ